MWWDKKVLALWGREGWWVCSICSLRSALFSKSSSSKFWLEFSFSTSLPKQPFVLKNDLPKILAVKTNSFQYSFKDEHFQTWEVMLESILGILGSNNLDWFGNHLEEKGNKCMVVLWIPFLCSGSVSKQTSGNLSNLRYFHHKLKRERMTVKFYPKTSLSFWDTAVNLTLV